MGANSYSGIYICVGGQAQCVTWSAPFTSTLSIGATLYAQYNSIASCQAFCTSLSNCSGVDVDLSGTTSNGCWVHFSASDFTKQYAGTSVTQYQVVTRGACKWFSVLMIFFFLGYLFDLSF